MANSSLRPAWRNQSGGRGFQPPPSVLSAEAASPREEASNPFAALDEDDVVAAHEPSARSVPVANNSRSAALRTTNQRGRSGSTSSGGNNNNNNNNNKSGRRLADLERTRPAGATASGGAATTTSTSSSSMANEAKVIRFTRERLLSMRPTPLNQGLPAALLELAGHVIVADAAQDPVCWDNLEDAEIWATVPLRRATKSAGGRSLSEIAGDGTTPTTTSVPGGRVARGSSTAGRWKRGVALPPPSAATEGKRRDSSYHKSDFADNPNDLWDDPTALAAAGDFSAFGDLESHDSVPIGAATGAGGIEAFDFDKMAQESQALEQELHGRARAASEASSTTADGHVIPAVKNVDSHRPLASRGMQIMSGSGDNVNVFEDFDEPQSSSDSTPTAVDPENKANKTNEEAKKEDDAPGSNNNGLGGGAAQDVDATSRLMAMIGVSGSNNTSKDAAAAPGSAAASPALSSAWGQPEMGSDGLAIPLNPWGSGPLLGDSLLSSTGAAAAGGGAPGGNQPVKGLDLQAQLRETDRQQKALQDELARQQQQQQQQAEANKRAAARPAQPAEGVQSQVELVLMERISNILENSWGRSDLASVLSTLHAEDSRVIPLLSSIDALRALMLRHSTRVALRHDPSFGSEMAVLLVTNAQWQQQQQQRQQEEALVRARRQEEELRRAREQQQRQRLVEEEQAAALRKQQMASSRPIQPSAPWYYSDPQQNIQGPFRGEEMRQWLEAGYFKGDLPVSQDTSGPFRPLSSLYQDLSMAFLAPGSSRQPEPEGGGAEAEHARRQAEQQAEREQQQREAEKQERLAQEAAEKERQAAEYAERQRLLLEQQQQQANAAAAEERQSNGNESSTQLKMMLGVSAQEQQAQLQQQQQDMSNAPSSPSKRGSSKSKKASAPKAASAPEVPAATPKPTAPAWGAPTQKQVSKKSMSEIQQEEARLAALQSMQRDRAAPSGSGWANVAAAKTGPQTSWNAAKVAPTAAAPKPTTTTKPTQVRKQSSGTSAPRTQVPATHAQVTTKPPSQGGAVASDDFGAQMSPALEKWCKEQMVKLNGSDDLTLVSFCMTLNDPSEIRQYLVTYLGGSPQVNSFANEFIQRKMGNKPVKEEWETSGSKKKGKKKAGR